MARLEKVLLFKYNGRWRTEIFEEDGIAFFHHSDPDYDTGLDYAMALARLYQLPMEVDRTVL